MNSRRLIWIAVVALAVAAAFALGWSRFNGAPQGNLAGASVGGAFAGVDQDGRPLSDAAFAGRYRLMYFGYTSCPDVCPTDVAALARGVAAFAGKHPDRAARLAALFVTVDPERDTPVAMKQFVRAFSPGLIGLTGTPQQMAAMRQRFAIYAKKVPGSSPQDYLMDHFAVIYLFGPKGEPIAFLSHGATAVEIAAMLADYVH